MDEESLSATEDLDIEEVLSVAQDMATLLSIAKFNTDRFRELRDQALERWQDL